jgi:hypothetical protein
MGCSPTRLKSRRSPGSLRSYNGRQWDEEEQARRSLEQRIKDTYPRLHGIVRRRLGLPPRYRRRVLEELTTLGVPEGRRQRRAHRPERHGQVGTGDDVAHQALV